MLERVAGILDSRLWVADGGVRGREPVPERDKVSNLRMSACEYEAPIIFLLSGDLDVFEVVRQKGEADEDRSTWTISWATN